ncbi:MarR family transcriptional regulator [Rhodobacteraceae bacterium]|nr:MarR family transcriptional regulator [Paracoccaceae bacterium]
MSGSDIQRLRRFNRIITSALGVLDDHYLGRGRSLGAARVLQAIGWGVHDLAMLRKRLDLDSGLMSRLLRGLEAEDLVALHADPNDARKRLVSLTPRGQAEHSAYEELSDDFARTILHHTRDRDAFLQSVDQVAATMGRANVVISPCDPETPDAQSALEAYCAEIAARLSHGFDPSASGGACSDMMRAPRGCFLLAMSDDLAVGCVGLQPLGPALGEVKRLWVAPSYRGTGISRRLMGDIEMQARDMGMDRLRLDTAEELPEARALYLRSGWREIDRYNRNPYAAYFFEKIL